MFGPGSARDAAQKVATRLKFPQAFGVFLALFLINLVVPDAIPFIDEILLGLGAALFGMWREPAVAAETPGRKPPEKNVTPRPD
ncbi:MAG: hypothetical protein KJ058_13405 [Thermoanaerobaculia bacterium]|nr:hypothetical protein [Thermoanaerobaculia bacterium]